LTLTEARRAAGMSQRQLAQAANLRQPHISMVETRAVKAYPRWRESLAGALGLAVDQIDW
jgi:transcriptional regulator with XRE-family HTH domain